MGGDSAGQRDRLMAELMDRGFAAAQAMQLSPWTSPRKPPSARYMAANFDPNLIIPQSTPRLAVAKADPPAAASIQALSIEQRVAGPAVPPPAEGSVAPSSPSIGTWAIQVGSFSDSRLLRAAQSDALSGSSDG
jgi:hypothetical protein